MARKNPGQKPDLEEQPFTGVEYQESDTNPSLAKILIEPRSQQSQTLSCLDDIDICLENVTDQVSTMKETLIKTNQVLEKQQQRMDEAEQRISTLEDTLQVIQRELH